MARGAPTPTLAALALVLAASSVALHLCASSAASTPTTGRPPVAPGLSYGFYKRSCPQAESMVRRFVHDAVLKDVGVAAGLLRLHFHDCFVQGCDASVLLNVNGSGEKKAQPNLTLRPAAFKAVNDMRDLLDKACGGPVVSCADILTLAARDSVGETGGPRYEVPLGRRDSANHASVADVTAALPAPFFKVPAMLKILSNMNLSLDATDLVALSGAHTIGLGHCTSFEGRLFPQADPAMDAAFAAHLKQVCPAMGAPGTTPLDARTPDRFDNRYYVDMISRQGLFTSDQDLFTHAATRTVVDSFAKSQKAFFRQFALSMVKMGQIKVLTGDRGQVRTNCEAPNPRAVLPWSVVVEDAADSFVI
ncbi:hypothetical protein BS78_03G413300 [Paspalum vaginatum]|nr:hypothetical protein BS78_03G413300 [Paspalum vaginatum]